MLQKRKRGRIQEQQGKWRAKNNRGETRNKI